MRTDLSLYPSMLARGRIPIRAEGRSESPVTRFSDLIRTAFPGRAANLSADPVITGIELDSRRVQPGNLFVALRGIKDDGAAYAADAVRRGAVAILAERRVSLPPSLPQLVDPRARTAAARLAAALHGFPADALRLVGITGTNGKTTTAWMLREILRRADVPTGMIGTIAHWIGDRRVTSRATTPDAVTLQPLLAEMVEAGMDTVVMEVSSHALTQDRVHGVSFDTGVFTNLSREHLDYHGTMDEYADAKGRLFEGLGRGAVAVLNADDPLSARYAGRTRARVVSYGLENAADVKAGDLRTTPHGTSYRICGFEADADVANALLGRFNVVNGLAAAVAARSLGCDTEAIRAGLTGLEPVPGRLERVEGGQDFHVVIDYAHTPDALEKVLGAVREFAQRRVITVFGCGGDRDRGKRPEMGQAAGEASDLVIVTSDNPRSENPEAIIADILPGLPGNCEHRVIPDRAEALETALEMAGPEDVVLVAGKGHETYQILKDVTVPFDDHQVVENILNRRANEGVPGSELESEARRARAP
jgi:UDP-N-acetylmuramoyl-L-alanyl-D-glutamate--2,6-diaminopimelate ligase